MENVEWVAVAEETAAHSTARPSASLEQHDGASGFWLRSPAVEVFVALEPVFRVLALRQPGRASLLADGTVAEQGLRLAFMEPEQNPVSFEVGNRPAVVLERTAQTAWVKLAAYAGLRYTVTLAVESHRARLRLEFALENVGESPRRVACWSVLSFARQGRLVVPLDSAGDARGGLVLPVWTPWPQPGVRVGRQALTAELDGALNGPAYKVGVATDAGWIALQRGAAALCSAAAFDPAASYPEGGANITFFEADDGADRVWCEVEHVSPLQRVPPGRAVTLSQTVELFDGVPPAPADPDVHRRSIEARLPPA